MSSVKTPSWWALISGEPGDVEALKACLGPPAYTFTHIDGHIALSGPPLTQYSLEDGKAASAMAQGLVQQINLLGRIIDFNFSGIELTNVIHKHGNITHRRLMAESGSYRLQGFPPFVKNALTPKVERNAC